MEIKDLQLQPEEQNSYVDEIATRIQEIVDNGQENSFYLLNINEIIRRINLWDALLPRVEMFYSVKCNSDQKILETLIKKGKGCECASYPEIQKVIKCGSIVDQIIYAHCIKDRVHLKIATELGVNLLVFDSAEELEKIKQVNPNAQLILRIAILETEARCSMTKKFGAVPSLWPQLLQKVIDLNLRLRGVAFHVGSGGVKINIYEIALQYAKKVFEMTESYKMTPLDILNIGGGFSMSAKSGQNFNEVAPRLALLLDKYFPISSNIRIMAEPGRIVCQSSCTLAMRIIGIKDLKEHGRHYYINGGIYQGFSAQVYDLEFNQPEPLLTQKQKMQRQLKQSIIWGQTSDGLDIICKNILFPEMEDGEWIMFRNTGAYSIDCNSTYNGYEIPDVLYIEVQDLNQFVSNLFL